MCDEGIDDGGRAPALIIHQDVRVEHVIVNADIGVSPEEIGNLQPLIVDIRLELMPLHEDRLDATTDYRRLVERAERLGRSRIGLIETFAHRLAAECLSDARVLAAEVRIRKPHALKNGTASASVRLSRQAACDARPVASGAGLVTAQRPFG